ncbi:MAG: Trk family potassium uptake protein [Chloroflexi bacterium]|nr:Trk family potassium uptake protein [Chloroflexota bacterium]
MGTVVAGFLVLIAIGTILLCLPVARAPDASFDFVTSLFTATSAVCVTGLVVVDTGTHWSHFGQGVILALIQLGGLGIMTAAMSILLIFARPVSLGDRFAIRETLGLPGVRSVATLIVATVILTILLEAGGGTVLWLRLRGSGLPGWDVWQSAFHAVSAFNNAGFDIRGTGQSLAEFTRDPVVLMTICVLVIAGGLGALVILDLAGSRSLRRLSVQSKLVLLTTLALLVAGLVATLASEYHNPATLGGFNVTGKITNAFFHSVNARTAGFSTMPMNATHDDTQFLTMALMSIGGATGGTAGGIKVGTFAVLMLVTLATAKGYTTVRVFGREIPHGVVYRALGVATLYLGVIFVGTLILSITETALFRQVFFEVFSAVGTVGLTTGITPELSTAGRSVVVALMFVGRVGPLVLVYLLTRKAREPLYHLPEARIGIG